MANNPEIGRRVRAGAIDTNLHDTGSGYPVLLIHGSGPGVTAWANWRLAIPALAQRFRVIAPDMVGFGYTERPANIEYRMDVWVRHAIDVLDALNIERAHLVGNSFGGALGIALAVRHPQRINRLVLMGSAGISFPLPPGLDQAWGYEPSLANMKKLLDVFAYDRHLVTDALAEMRYQASIRPGYQESFAAMFPAPRQRWIEALATPEDRIRAISHETLIIHGREDKVIPLENAYRLLRLIERSQLHVFGRCGHWTQIEHGARFNRLLTEFFLEA